jgi:uncharacterized membrane protein
MGDTILEIMYIICGLMTYYVGINALKDEEHESRVGTAVFWLALGTVMIFGRWLPDIVSGILIVIMAIPATLNKVAVGKGSSTTKEYKEKMSDKFGNKIFIPAFMMGVFALLFAIFTDLGALVGLGIGTIVSAIIVLIMTKDKPQVIPREGKSLLEAVGPLSMLPQLLSSLGAIFAAAGVGEVIAQGVEKIVPEGNVVVGTIVYAVGMAIFTMIMGNAFAAFSVITLGIGAPFVLKYGLNPNVIGILGLTCGYCGTLMTPMAANFNIVPVAILEMKDKYGVIKKQIIIALTMLVLQIILMNIMG